MTGCCGPDSAASREVILEAFRHFDQKGDGLIERGDLSKVLMKLDTAFWTNQRLDILLGGFCQDKEGTVEYEQFLLWLYEGGSAHTGFQKAGAPAAGGGSLPGAFTLMTFNVEEYYHGYSSKKGSGQLKDCVFETVRGIRGIIEAHSPDVLCLEEHSLGSDWSEKEIMDALIGDLGYEYVSERTGEDRAWYSGLANAVLWKGAHFKLEQSWRVELAGPGDLVPGTSQRYTPRAAACAELTHASSGKRLVVCATHLLGGRFEDSCFVSEALAGRNVRSEQVRKIARSIQATCGEEVPSVVAGDFNVMREGLREGSPFRQAAESYFHGKLIGGALSMASQSGQQPNKEDYLFDAFYVPFQTQVHETFSTELGYTVAYGRNDNLSEMKTTFYSGCIDWVYTRKLKSLRDEKVVSAIDEGLSDHNAVIVTLQLE